MLAMSLVFEGLCCLFVVPHHRGCLYIGAFLADCVENLPTILLRRSD